MNFTYPNTMYKSILAQMYGISGITFTIFAFDHEKGIKQKLQKLFFYQKYVHLGKNTFIHCSRITVVHIHVTVFLKNLPDLLTVTQTESNQEVTTK